MMNEFKRELEDYCSSIVQGTNINIDIIEVSEDINDKDFIIFSVGDENKYRTTSLMYKNDILSRARQTLKYKGISFLKECYDKGLPIASNIDIESINNILKSNNDYIYWSVYENKIVGYYKIEVNSYVFSSYASHATIESHAAKFYNDVILLVDRKIVDEFDDIIRRLDNTKTEIFNNLSNISIPRPKGILRFTKDGVKSDDEFVYNDNGVYLKLNTGELNRIGSFFNKDILNSFEILLDTVDRYSRTIGQYNEHVFEYDNEFVSDASCLLSTSGCQHASILLDDILPVNIDIASYIDKYDNCMKVGTFVGVHVREKDNERILYECDTYIFDDIKFVDELLYSNRDKTIYIASIKQNHHNIYCLRIKMFSKDDGYIPPKRFNILNSNNEQTS